MNTSAACGLKVLLWFLALDFINKDTLEWTPAGQDVARVNKEVMPLAKLIMQIGNPTAVYSTPTTKDMANQPLPPDQAGKPPGGIPAFPPDFLAQPTAGEFLAGVYKCDGKDVLYVANHNALAPQEVRLKFAKAGKVSVFDRKEGSWKPLPLADGTATIKLEGGGGEVLKVE